MSASARTGLQLPKKLLDELGAADSKPNGSRRQRVSLAAQRKQQRKASRVEKRTKPQKSFHSKSHTVRTSANKSQAQGSLRTNKDSDSTQPATIQVQKRPSRPVPEPSDTANEDFSEDEEDHVDATGSHVSRAVRHQLEDDDAQIARLEKKLGRKRKQPDDGMGSIFKDLDGISDDEDDTLTQGPKYDREAEEWLRAKRRKASHQSMGSKEDQKEEDDDDDNVFSGISDGDEVTFDPEDASGDDGHSATGDSDESGSEQVKAPRKRENPYIAPLTQESEAKYIPPSRRMLPTSDNADQQRLRRQIQGLLNRLSESNILDIVKQIGQLYSNNARNDVTRTLLDLLLDLLSDRTALNDTFIILHAGFIAALHKTVGIELGAAAVQRFVEEYDKQAHLGPEKAEKKPVNLIHTLAQLYNFQVIGSGLVYDFIKVYIQRLSEEDAELLLKVVRNSGFQLRQDDPKALKDISIMLQETIKRLGGEDKLNVRTRFMVETIDNLKNNRSKTGQGVAAMNAEHVMRMKKTLASIHSTSGLSVRTSEPLRISLADIRDSDLKGKWWLVGASFRDQAQIQGQIESARKEQPNTQLPSAESVSVDAQPDMAALARAFGMNTDIRKALFVNIMTAATADEARERLVKMRLTKRQMREVPPVLIRCATAEKTFNQYYAEIAKRLSSQEREIRKALWNPLLEMLSNLETDESGDDEDLDQWWQSPQAKFNTAKLYGSLIADGTIPITVLANQELLHPPEGVRTFLELVFVGFLVQIGKGNVNKLETILRQAAGRDDSPTFIPVLRRFFRRTVAKTVLVAANEKKAVQWGCEKSDTILAELENK